MSPRFNQLFIITHGAQDERVEAALVHIEHLLNSARGRGVVFRDILVLHMSAHRITTIATCQSTDE